MRPTLLAATLFAACTGPGPGADDTDDTTDTDALTDVPGEDTTVVALDAVGVWFTGDDNRRTVDTAVSFPAAGPTYASITLSASVHCPTGGTCDPWDRWGFLGLVLDAGTEDERVVELSRFITPYGVGFDYTLDVTELRPLLAGDATLRVFIDTWVGPGSVYGDGWEVDVTFDFVGGTAPRRVLGVIPAFGPTQVVYGDPARPPAEALPPVEVALPPGTTSAALRTFITGHGQGNADNCAEFCPKDHTLTVGEDDETRSVWRDNCDKTGAPGQQGSWTYPRAGWCPGAQVRPWAFEAAASGSVTVAWSVEDFVNTCRPDAPTCTGCTLGTGCDYDGGAHTEPNHAVSGVVVAYVE